MKIIKMKKISIVLVLVAALYGCGASKVLLTADKSPVKVSIDLINVADDKVVVEINPGAFTTDAVSFYIPKTVPGTYSVDNYGKYIEGFKAYDYKGNELSVAKGDLNTWVITDGKSLDKIKYWVNDTYDSEQEEEEPVFSPAGTNILEGENFVLNLHGFVGYFNNLKEVPYILEVDKPATLTATTSLPLQTMKESVATKDVFTASRYFQVVDNPIFYAKPNTETFQINDISVTLSVYSPNGVYTAASLKDRMKTMMAAQKAFLGEMDGTKQYSILLYLSDINKEDAGGFGALEHHTSTVVVLPETMTKDYLEQTMVDVVSHEFFHIVTPLNVHSKEVQYFDFNDPKMSQHLWMYEGTTEYFANLFQIQQGLINEDEFYERIREKISNAKHYDDSMSFTTMSKNILVEPYKANYANVYEKGTLINMVLDLQLREWSKGEKGVLWLMKELSKKYGNNTPFDDEKLFDEIIAMTYPELRNFFDTHVIGDTPIDYNAHLAKVGLELGMIDKPCGRFFLDEQVPFIDVDESNDNAVYVREHIALSSFLIDMGVKPGDIIKQVNGTDITLERIGSVIRESFIWSSEKEITMVVLRDGAEIELKGVAGNPVVRMQAIAVKKDASDAQNKLRQAWLKGI